MATDQRRLRLNYGMLVTRSVTATLALFASCIVLMTILGVEVGELLRRSSGSEGVEYREQIDDFL